MTRRVRLGLYTIATAAAVLLAAGLGGVLALRSEWFREWLRERIVEEVESASGGRAELRSFEFDWSQLRAELRGFVLHGAEPAGVPPLFRAESIAVGLRIVSALKRDIDIESLVVARPEVNLLIAADGRTNLPRPKKGSGRDAVAEILKLAIGEFELKDGAVAVAERRFPLDVRGRGFRARVTYEAASPRYRGEAAAGELSIGLPGARSVKAAAAVAGTLERDRVELTRVNLASGKSRLGFAGAIESLRTFRLAGAIDVLAQMEDLAPLAGLPLRRQGQVQVAGKGWFAGTNAYLLDGRIEGRQLSVVSHGVRAAVGRLTGTLRLEPGAMAVDDLRVSALGGHFSGQARLRDFRRLSLDGAFRDIPVASLGQVHAETARIPWDGSVSGALKLETELSTPRPRNTELRAELTVARGNGSNPLEGSARLIYLQRLGQVRFEESRLATAATSVRFGGVLGERLRVELRTSDLADLTTAAAAFGEGDPVTPPIKLERGSAYFRGVVVGPLDEPRIRGRVALENFKHGERLFERAGAGVDLTRSSLRAASVVLEQGGTRLTGSGEAALANWRLTDVSRIKASAALQGVDLKSLARETGSDLAAAGTLAGDAQIAGTAGKPEVAANVRIEKLQVAGESFDRARARLRYAPGTIEVSGARLESGKAGLDLSFTYTFPAADVRSGRLRFDAAAERVPLASLKRVRDLGFEIDGTAGGKLAGALTLAKGEPRLEALDGKVSLREIAYRKRPAGSLELALATRSGRLSVTAAGALRGAALRGAGEWELAGGYTGGGKIELAALTFSHLRELAAVERRWPFDGVIEGQASLSGSLLKPGQMQGEVRIATVELRSAARKELSLRNETPVVAAIDAKGVHIRSARFVGRETSLEVLGTFSTQARNAWNLEIRGGLDLALISSLYPELVTSGRASLNANVRGSLDAPVFGGRMELQKASVFLAGVPSGIENADGLLYFDRNRATIEHLTAQAGGGQLRLSGFVGIGGPELVYRLQAEAEKVRVRYPEGVSTTATASLSLVGTSTRSLLAGSATIERAAFNPRTDIGSLLAESVRPVTTPVPSNPVLAGMQFDIRVTSSPALEVRTSLASNLQAEADLRLRGSAAKPVVLGRVSVNQGEIQFFGNKYSITRGEVSFYNPARIEPVLDLNLETRVRGVIVNLVFTGPMSKLNMSYRSDPPLQSQEVIALLAVGRAPGSNPTQAGAQLSYSQGGLPSGTESLIGQAVSTPISSRLQRFFGVSRLKIDPHLTGTAITPQARLTVEQQISRDITLTYVTNLSETKEQLVRVEWDLNRQWSVVALRDENGTFGVDFLYKKRFR